MSATILDIKAFCKDIGLEQEYNAGNGNGKGNIVKFISVSSEFLPENRPIFPLNTAQLNYKTLQLQNVRDKIVQTIDELMLGRHKE